MGQTALLERAAELASLDALVSAARGQQGGIAVVEGEAGVGKSRLLAAARDRARELGLLVLSARGSHLERAFAFGVARQLLDRPSVAPAAPSPGIVELLPDVSADVRSDAGLAIIQALHSTLVELVWSRSGRARAPALLLTVDDAQWADDQSLRFLAHIALRIDELPVALVAAVRSGEANTEEALLAELRQAPTARVLRPRALSDAAVEILVRDALGDESDTELTVACARATDGNPFYLHELLRTLQAEPGRPSAESLGLAAPRAVLRSVMVRLERVGGAAPDLARAVAVLGDASLRTASTLAALDVSAAEAAADALARAGILVGGEPLRFAHPLIAAALESDMGAFARARAHRRAADLLQEQRASAEHVAAHLLLSAPAGDVDVVRVLEDAATATLDGGDPAGAARLLARALAEPPPPERCSEIILALARAEAISGSPLATDRLERALDDMDLPEARADALTELATLLHHRGEFGRASQLARRAREELEPSSERYERLLGIELGAALLHPQLVRGVRPALEPLLTAARTGRPPSDAGLLALVVGWMGASDDLALVRELARAAIANDPLIDASHGASVGWVGSALYWIDELELAESWLDAAVDAADGRGAVIAGAVATLQRSWVRLQRGRLDLAVADGERALEIYRYGWTSSPWSTPILAEAHIARGDLDAAREAIAVGERAGGERPEFGLLLEAKARLHLAEGDPAAALGQALDAGEHAEGGYGIVQPRVWSWRRLAATAAHRMRRDAEGMELIEPDLAALRKSGPARQLGAALTAAGLVIGGDEGLDLLGEAATVLEPSPAALQRAQTLVELGGALRRAGRRTAAKEPLLASLALAAELGALPLERRARDELRGLGLKPRRAERTGVASLTPTELRVAGLAADGLSTPQIAYELHVTRNTVETHLRHIYRKLDLSGRGQLHAALTAAPVAGEARHPMRRSAGASDDALGSACRSWPRADGLHARAGDRGAGAAGDPGEVRRLA